MLDAQNLLEASLGGLSSQDRSQAGGGVQKKLLREVFDALERAEVCLGGVRSPGKSEAIDLVLRLRRKIIEEFPHAETGVELEGDAS